MINVSVIKTASALTLSLYDQPGAVAIDWTHRIDDPICWAVKQVAGIWYLVFRGSKTRDDWEHDFEVLPVYVDELKAHVHSGFNQGVRDILMEANSIIGDNLYVICGHSLGAARAAIASAYAIANYNPPLARISWGEPRPGFSDLAKLLSEIPNYNFVNGGKWGYDHVTDVPVTLPFIWYCAGAPQLFVDEPPAGENPLMIYAGHNFLLYDTAMNKLPDGEM